LLIDNYTLDGKSLSGKYILLCSSVVMFLGAK
jgi:hypothetical protein